MAWDTHPFTLTLSDPKTSPPVEKDIRSTLQNSMQTAFNPFISIMLAAGTHAGSSFHRRECAARKHLKVVCFHLLMPPCTDVLSLNLGKAVTAPFYSATSHRASLSSELRTVVQNESGLL